MPGVEGVGIVDVSSSKVLATVSRGRLSHSTVESRLKSAISDSNIAWENSLCIATPIHVVAITQARKSRTTSRRQSSTTSRGNRRDEDDYMNVEDAHGDSSFVVQDECDWETFVFPVLDRCSKVVLAACGPKPTVSKIEKNFAAVYLGLMKVLVLGCDGVSTVLAVNKRASGLMPWPSSSKSKAADDHPLLSAAVLNDEDERTNHKNGATKADSIRFMLESASILEQFRLDLPKSESNGQTNVTSSNVNDDDDEEIQLLSMFGSSFQPPVVANRNFNEEDEEDDLDVVNHNNNDGGDSDDEEEYMDCNEEEEDERNSHSTEEKEGFIDGQPQGNYSRIKVATPTRKRRTLSTGTRERLKEESERARNRGEGKSGEDGPLRKKTSSSLEGVRVPEEAAAALAALEGQDVGRDLAGSLSQEEDETLVVPPPLFSPPSQLNHSGWFTEDVDSAAAVPPPFSPPSETAPIGVASRAMSLSYVPPPDEPPPPEEDDEFEDDDEHIASPSTPPLDDVAQEEEEEEEGADDYGSYSGRPFPPPLPSHGSFSSYESAAGLFNRSSLPGVPAATTTTTSDDEDDDDGAADEGHEGKAERYLGPTTPIVPPPMDDDVNHERDSVLSPLDPPSDYEEEEEIEVVPPPAFPPPLSEGEEEESRVGDTSGQSSTWGIPQSMQRYATTTTAADEQQQEAPEDGGSSQASNERDQQEDEDSMTDFDPFADSTDDLMSSPALQVVLPPPLFSPEASSDEEEGRFASSSAMETHGGSDDDENDFDEDSAPPPPGPPPPFDESDEDVDELDKTKILEPSSSIGGKEESFVPDEVPSGQVVSPRRASVPPPAYAPPSDDDDEADDVNHEYDDDIVAPPPSSPPPPFEDIQAEPVAVRDLPHEEEGMIVPPPASPSPSDDDHAEGEEQESMVQESVVDVQSLASPVPRVIEYDENDILPPPESPSSAEGDERPSHSFFSGHLADTSAYLDEDDVDADEDDQVSNNVGVVTRVEQEEETNIPPPSSPPPESDNEHGDDVVEQQEVQAPEEPLQGDMHATNEQMPDDAKDVSPIAAPRNRKLEESTNSDHVHILVSLSDDPSMSQIMMSEADSYLTNESSLSLSRSPTRSYLGRQQGTHQSMTSVAEEQQTDLDESSSIQSVVNGSSNAQAARTKVMAAGSASNVFVASRRVSDPPPAAAGAVMLSSSSLTAQQQQFLPIRIDLHVHEDCVMRVQRGAFVQVPKFRAKLYVGSPEASQSSRDVIVGPIAFHHSNDERALIRLEPVGGGSRLMTSEASEGFQVTIPKGTPTNPPLQFGHYYTENEKVALPIKVASGIEFIRNQATGRVMGHIIVKLVGNPNCGPSEFLSMSVEVSLADLPVDCGIVEDGFKFSPPNARYNSSTRRILWEPSAEPFGLGVSQMFQAKFWSERELPKQALSAVVRFECKGVLYSNTDAQIASQEYKLRGVAKRTLFKVDCLV